MCCIYLYVLMMTRPFFRLPPGGTPLNRCHVMISTPRRPRRGLMASSPGPTVIDCICVVYTLWIRCTPPSFSPFNWTAFQFERNKICFLFSWGYFAAFLPLGSPPPKLTTIFSGPVGLLVRSSMYFLPPPNPCFRSIIDLTPMLPPQFGLLTN